MKELVFKGENNQALTNSLLVAEKFEKEHKHVLEAIRELIKGSAEMSADPMFAEVSYINEQNGQEYPMFVMNYDGFTLLAMGFKGKKALRFKLDYIAAFNKMGTMLKEDKPKVAMSSAEMFAMQANINLEYERRLSSIENKLQKMEEKRIEDTNRLLSAPLSDEKTPELALKDNIRQLVNKYSNATGISQRDVWHKVYSQLYYLYKISINAYKKVKKGETNLSVAERNGFLDKIYTIISNMVREGL